MGASFAGMAGKMTGATVALRETNRELSKLTSTANRSVKLGQNMQAAAQNVQSANAALRMLNSALNTFANTAAKTGVLAQKMQQGAQATQTATVALRQATTQASGFARAAMAAGAAMGGIGSGRGARSIGSTQGAFATLAGNVGDVRNLLLGAATAMGAFMGAQKVFEYTDTFTAMQSQLRLVTSSTQELNRTYEQLYSMAQNTRQSLDGTVNLYARITRATKSLNISQEDTISLTDAINKSVAIFGGPAASAEAALFQLSQGFASGALRGEELNSVLEQSPRLAQAIADGMGVAVGSLRGLAEQGKLTSEAVLNAIMSQREKIDDEFAKVGVTVGQAFVVANNAVLDYIGRVDKAAQTSQNFSKSIMEATKILRDPAMLTGGVRAMELFGQALQFTVGVAKLVVTNLDLLLAAVAAVAAAMVAPAVFAFAGALAGAGRMALG
jgi:tape measure domain-containing protein